jgi:DNA anti-recombination protein RmuC
VQAHLKALMMERGFAQAAERDEALRREFQQQGDGLRQEFQQQIDGLRQEMQQQIDGLRREMQQQIDGLRREMQQGFAQAAERDEALRREIARLERWLFTLWVPVLGALVGVLGLLLQILLRLS